MSEMVYLYDGTFEVFLCCVFESYSKHEVLTAVFSDEDFEPVLFATRTVQTVPEHAARVYQGIRRRSVEAAHLVRRGFLTCLENREMCLYRLIARLFREGPGFLGDLSDETLYPILKAVRFLGSEAEKYRGFVRFSELSGVLGAEIEPRNRVLPILRLHFCERYQNERFFIYDRTHCEALFYAEGKSAIVPLEHFSMAPPDAEEAGYRLLWKRFYDTIAIRERENPKCRMTHMPKRYWASMTEFQGPSYFKVHTASEAAPKPGAPAGIPGPATPRELWPSAPASDP